MEKEVRFIVERPSRIQSWKVKEGFFLPVGHVILSYVELDDGGNPAVGGGLKRLKATQAGVIQKIHVREGQTVTNGATLVTLGPCSHPTVMRDMCAECGMDLRKLDEPAKGGAAAASASVSMIHSVPDLRISMEQAQIIGKGDEERLLKQKKLVLLVDLDQTIIHTTNDNVPHNLKDVFHFQLWGHGSMWYHTRLRPGTREFLERIGMLYELHICTFGTRSYAHTIAKHLDSEGRYFSDRILSRDECFSQNSKTANLKELFPRGDHMVCIIDDREDVWNYAPNLIHVKPYHFFRHTGDINAPPGLTKQDEDDKSGFSFSKDGTASAGPTLPVAKEEKVGEGEEKSGPTQEQKSEEGTVEATGNVDQVDTKMEVVDSAKKKSESDAAAFRQKEEQEVKGDLSLSDDEESCSSDKSEEEANEGDKEESMDENEAAPAPNSSLLCEPADVSAVDAPLPLTAITEGDDDVVSSSSIPLEEAVEVLPTTPSQPTACCDSSTDLKGREKLPTDKPEPSILPDSSTATPTVKPQPTAAEVNQPAKAEDTASVESSSAGGEQGKVESSCMDSVDSKAPSEGEVIVAVDLVKAEGDVEEGEVVKEVKVAPGGEFVEVEDQDDYLMYLEQILRSIHEAFYSLHSDTHSRGEPKVPDVKSVIPYVRKKILKGVSIVFSGVVPMNIAPSERKNSKAYSIASSLGATVSEKIIPPNKPCSSSEVPTTHIVAARMGTAKVNEARRYKGMHVVTPDWLWCCSERWERVDERLYSIFKKTTGSNNNNIKRNHHHQLQQGSSRSGRTSGGSEQLNNNATVSSSTKNGAGPAARKERTPSGRFMDTINPLLSFSMDEIESMGHEVDDICNESESSSSSSDDQEQKKDDDEVFTEKLPLRRRSSRSKSDELATEHKLQKQQSIHESNDKEGLRINKKEEKNSSSSSSSPSSSSSGSEDGTGFDEETGVCVRASRKRKRGDKTEETETEDEPLNVRFRRGEALPSEVEDLNLMNGTSDDDATNDQDEEWMAEALEREFLNEEDSRDQE